MKKNPMVKKEFEDAVAELLDDDNVTPELIYLLTVWQIPHLLPKLLELGKSERLIGADCTLYHDAHEAIINIFAEIPYPPAKEFLISQLKKSKYASRALVALANIDIDATLKALPGILRNEKYKWQLLIEIIMNSVKAFGYTTVTKIAEALTNEDDKIKELFYALLLWKVEEKEILKEIKPKLSDIKKILRITEDIAPLNPRDCPF